MSVRGIETHNGHIIFNSTLYLSADIEMILRSGVWVFSGEGNPNGAIDPWLSAPIGSIYLNKAPADCSLLIWYKKADVGELEDWCYATGSVMG